MRTKIHSHRNFKLNPFHITHGSSLRIKKLPKMERLFAYILEWYQQRIKMYAINGDISIELRTNEKHTMLFFVKFFLFLESLLKMYSYSTLEVLLGRVDINITFGEDYSMRIAKELSLMRKIDKRWEDNSEKNLFFYKRINDYTFVVWWAKDNFLEIQIRPYTFPCEIYGYIKVDNIINDIF